MPRPSTGEEPEDRQQIQRDQDSVRDEHCGGVSFHRITAGQPFYVEHGWVREDWSSESPAEQQAFISDSTRFDLFINGRQIALSEEFFVENDQANKGYRFQFYGNLSQTTHRLVGEWVEDDFVELRVILDLDITP